MAPKEKNFTKTTVYQPGYAEDTRITTPGDFGMPSDPMPIPYIEQPVEVFPETAPTIITGKTTRPARGKSGMTLAKEEAIADRKMDDIGLERKDAFQFVINALKPYGLDGVGAVLNDLMVDPTIGPAKAEYIVKYDTTINPKTGKPFNDAYAQRFAANFERIKAGKPAYSEGEYMAYERQYAQTLSSMGYDNLATKANYEKWISGDVSPSEVAGRIDIAQEVYNSTPAVKEAFNTYFPGIGSQDIVTALLDSTTGIPALKRKAELAQIGATARQAGYGILTEARAAELAGAGISAAEAQQGYQKISGYLDRARQLADMQGESAVSLAEAEAATFGLSGATEAEKKIKRLASRDRALYEAQSGIAQSALTRERAGQY
jgi:hypothetical protein